MVLAESLLPEQCIDLGNSLPQGGQFIFENRGWLPISINCVLAVFYTVPIIWVYKNRKNGTFRTRSPKIIIVGFFLMMLDSILNTIWMTRPNSIDRPYKMQCDLSIVITVFIFYGVMSIYFIRMWRIYKVFDLYQKFLNLQKQEAEEEYQTLNFTNNPISTDRESVSTVKSRQIFDTSVELESSTAQLEENQPDNKLLEQMKEFQEHKILARLFLYMVPGYIIGILGCFIPWVYAFVPSHASEICLCSFYSRSINNARKYQYPYLHNSDFYSLLIINQLSFYVVNIIFLVALIFMVYKIRHINDNTFIKNECAIICTWWILCSTLQYVIFANIKIQICHNSQISSTNGVLIVSYWTVLIRNFITLQITIYYQMKVNKAQGLHQVLQTGGHDNTQQMMDFEILLDSVYPHKQFTEFLRTQRPEMIPYIKILRKLKLFKSKKSDMDAFLQEQPYNDDIQSVQSSNQSLYRLSINLIGGGNQNKFKQLGDQIQSLEKQIFDISWENKFLFLPYELQQDILIRERDQIEKSFQSNIEENPKIKEYLENINYLYQTSYNNLSSVFYNEFHTSDAFKEMIVVMHQNMIEYRFLTQAGLLKE